MKYWPTFDRNPASSDNPSPHPVGISRNDGSKNSDTARAIEKESEAMLAAIPAQERVIALDIPGKPQSTSSMADALRQWQMQGGNTSFSRRLANSSSDTFIVNSRVS